MLGAQRPRLSSVPEFISTAGPDVADLCDSVGVHLDDWQRHTLDCALAEDAAGRWAAFEVGLCVCRQNGKGEVLMARELAGLFLFGERLIIHSAHEYKTAAEAFLRIRNVIDGSAMLSKRVRSIRVANGEQGIELMSGARLRFVARTKGSGRGFTGDCVILDEAMILDVEMMAALMPTVQARPNPQVWYAGSAGLDDSDVWRAVRDRAEKGDAESLAYLEWSARDGCDPDDVDEWANGNPALGIRLTEQRIGRLREALPERQFLREILGIWPASAGRSKIPADAWGRLEDLGSTIDGFLAFGVSVPPGQDRVVIAAAGHTADGREHVETVESRAGTAWLLPRLRALIDSHSPVAVVIDPGSPSGILVPEIEAAGIPLIKTSARDYAQACGAFYAAAIGLTEDARVTEPTLRHMGQADLDRAVAGAKTRPLGDLWAWDRRDPNVDISPLEAVTLARHGLVTSEDGDPAANVW